jgi:hypothetical protein
MEHFGWLGAFFSIDKPAPSAKTHDLVPDPLREAPVYGRCG